MSYFTETFENILEFKDDVKASYSMRRAAEKMSGNHNIGKAAQANAKAYSADGHRPATNSKEYVSRTVDSKIDKKVSDHISNNKYAAKSAALDGEMRRSFDPDFRRANRVSNKGLTTKNMDDRYAYKPKKESYDPVYEDLCRMGIID